MKGNQPWIFAAALACGLCGCGDSTPLADAGSGPSGPGDEQPQNPPLSFGIPLQVARPTVIATDSGAVSGSAPLQTGMGVWHGASSHLAGTAHYDRGEWIYEDYPWTAYGAAQSVAVPVHQTLDALGLIYAPAQRLPGGLAVAMSQTGAGPHVDEADLSELRVAVDGAGLCVMARTTTMLAPVRTALLLLFDTGRAGSAVAVPFGSGLTTDVADVAALVTADGTRIVDLLTGQESTAPASADPTNYINVLETRLPLAQVGAADGSTIRFVAATGRAAPGSFALEAGGAAGPLAKVVPRFDEPVHAVYDRLQAVALAQHNIDRFFTEVSVQRLRAADSERLLPGIGYSVRTFVAPEALSSEGGTNGTLRQYGLYVPRGYSGSLSAATLLFRGSSMTAHGMAAVTPGLFQNLGDDNQAIVISPCGRSGFDGFQSTVYLDVMQTLADAQTLLPIDPDRLTAAGYSMGGYATYMFAATQPDLFAAAFVIAGPVGGAQPATSLYGFPDVIPMLDNLSQIPVEIFQGDIDASVPISNALAATQRLQENGYRYRYNLLLANTHFSPGIQNDYSIGARYIRDAKRASAPARVRFSRSMSYERAVDTGSFTDQPTAGQSVGLRFDQAWFVHELEAVDSIDGTATIDVSTLARPAGLVTPVMTAGVDAGPLTGQPLSPYQELSWQETPASDAPRNALEARLSGVARVRLDLADMALNVDEPLDASIVTDAASTLAFKLERAACVMVTEADIPLARSDGTDLVEVSLLPGAHLIRLAPCNN